MINTRQMDINSNHQNIKNTLPQGAGFKYLPEPPMKKLENKTMVIDYEANLARANNESSDLHFHGVELPPGPEIGEQML